jgi:hypothetical protein
MTTIPVELVIRELFDVFNETFERHHGIFTDRGTSLFETLATISAEEASRPVSAACASLAAHVEHVRFYLEVLEEYLLTKQNTPTDWGEIWRTVHTVSPEQWEISKNRLRDTYQRILALMHNIDTWQDEEAISVFLAMVVHTAYHLGEIRQALCFIKPSE